MLHVTVSAADFFLPIFKSSFGIGAWPHVYSKYTAATMLWILYANKLEGINLPIVMSQMHES